MNLFARTFRTAYVFPGDDVHLHAEEAFNQTATLVGIKGFKPTDPVEAMIAAQAVMMHNLAMEAVRRAQLPQQNRNTESRLRKDAANSARCMTDMVDALARYRGKGPQVIRVEKMLVADGGHAVVGSNMTSEVRAVSQGVAPLGIGGDVEGVSVPKPWTLRGRGGAMIQDRTINPMSPRCGACTRQGGSCGQLPMANGRCRIHGGLSTRPRTPEGLERMRAAKTIHGGRAADTIDFRRWVREMRADARRMIELA